MKYAEMVEQLEATMDADEFAAVMEAAEQADDAEAFLAKYVTATPKKQSASGTSNDFQVCEKRQMFRDARGEESERIIGYFVSMPRAGRTLYVGKTMTFQARPEFVHDTFATEDDAANAAQQWIEFERIQAEQMAKNVPVINIGCKWQIALVEEPSSGQQLKRSLTAKQTHALIAVREAALQTNARMPSGDPPKSLGDALELVLNEIANRIPVS